MSALLVIPLILIALAALAWAVIVSIRCRRLRLENAGLDSELRYWHRMASMYIVRGLQMERDDCE